MKYIGNKYRLIPFIEEVISKTAMNCHTFFDIFTGTTNVAQHYKRKGYRIISNDIMTYSYVLQMAYIKNNKIPQFNGLIKKIDYPKDQEIQKDIFDDYSGLNTVIAYLNKLEGIEGFIYKNYSYEGTRDNKFKRQYYTGYNAEKIDNVRQTIEQWRQKDFISINEYYILLASLIDEADYLANMSGTYGAFLKIWRSVARNKFKMKTPNLIKSSLHHEVHQKDANLLVGKVSADILYIDPPYNSRQYAANFHLPETIALYDNPAIYGVSGLRPYKDKISKYCNKSEASDALEDLVNKSKVKYIYLSYNNEGIITESDIEKILKAKGKYYKFKKTYRRFRTERNHEKRQYKDCDDKTIEYLHFCEIN